MKSIIFCSSQRFAKELYEFIDKLKSLAPVNIQPVIFHPNFDSDELAHLQHLSEEDRLKDPMYRATVATKVRRHNSKIRKADVCFIFNKNGYIGNNTFAELVAAAEHDKHVFALEGPVKMGQYPHSLYEEPVANEYVDSFISTPEELLRHLI